ncbi:hypothetical protein D9C73_011317 [Collichthys lucidus]|uniref:Uncharacterized protein n=1 Tax=Collichthys lucidus TaxID=240159 RepID=A0A4U5UQ97_COLLU|nr:hypothetical protein D9C73_011317 [Collichthys lucidus]
MNKPLVYCKITLHVKRCNVVIHDHSYSSKRLIAVRRTERTKKPAGHRQCPCCRDSQHSATPARLPQKRKRNSVARPSQPSPGQVSTASTSSLDQHDLLRYKNGHPRPYTLELGRQIKTELWERVGRPSFTETPAGHLHLQTLASSCTMTIQPAGCLHLQTVASSCTLILYLPASASRPPSSADSACSPPPHADCGKKREPDPPPTCLCHQPSGHLHLQIPASSCTLTLHLPAFSTSLQTASTCRRPPSSADSGKQLKPDPPPTCLCHQPAVHLHMQIVARSGSLILHLPASATSLQAASTCRFQQAAVPLPSTCQPFPPACRPPPPAGACRPPPPADSGKQLYPYPPPASLFHQPADRLNLQTVKSSFRLILHSRASTTSQQDTSTCRL